MKEDWKECKLGDVILFKNGKKRLSSIGNIPVYGGNGILGYSNESNHANCIIVGRVGAYCGNVFYEKNNCWISDNAIVGLPNINNDIRFCYYLISQLQLNKRCIGTGQPLLTQEILNRIDILLPPLATQQKIAQILSSLDDKIELNNKINNNLEQQAQAIFKSWFVDFEPFGGVMPEGWRIGKLSDIGTIIGGSTPSKAKTEYYTNNGIAWITPKDLSNDKSKFISHGEIDITELGFENSSAIKMPTGTVLYSSRAPIGYIAIAKNEVTTNQGFKSVIPNVNVGNGYIYYFLKSNYELIDSLASGSTFKEISGSAMKNVPVLVPDEQTLLDFQSFCFGIFDKQEKLEEENRNLASLRDTLLPKLMSGEIDVESVTI